ncbi:MAG: hypothetical protein Kow0090_16890 [Myxococcota bacterium]
MKNTLALKKIWFIISIFLFSLAGCGDDKTQQNPYYPSSGGDDFGGGDSDSYYDDTEEPDDDDNDTEVEDCREETHRRILAVDDFKFSEPKLVSIDIETGEIEPILDCEWDEVGSLPGCFSPYLSAAQQRVVMARRFSNIYKVSIFSLLDNTILDLTDVVSGGEEVMDWGLTPQFTQDGRRIIWRERFDSGDENIFALIVALDSPERVPEIAATATWLSRPFSIEQNKAGVIRAAINTNYSRPIYNARIGFVDIQNKLITDLALEEWELNHILASAYKGGKKILYFVEMDTTGCPGHYFEGVGEKLPICDLWLDRRTPPDDLCQYELRVYNTESKTSETVFKWCKDDEGKWNYPPPKLDRLASLSISFDNTIVAYTADAEEGGRREIYMIYLEGGKFAGPINKDGSYAYPTWFRAETERICDEAGESEI